MARGAVIGGNSKRTYSQTPYLYVLSTKATNESQPFATKIWLSQICHLHTFCPEQEPNPSFGSANFNSFGKRLYLNVWWRLMGTPAPLSSMLPTVCLITNSFTCRMDRLRTVTICFTLRITS
jgi:hypothetical protein